MFLSSSVPEDAAQRLRAEDAGALQPLPGCRQRGRDGGVGAHAETGPAEQLRSRAGPEERRGFTGLCPGLVLHAPRTHIQYTHAHMRALTYTRTHARKGTISKRQLTILSR